MEPGKSLEARARLVRRAHRRQRVLLERRIGLERVLRDDAAALDGDDDPLRQWALVELDSRIALDEFERDTRGGEEELVLPPSDPERPAQSVTRTESARITPIGAALPWSSPAASQLLW